MRYKIRFKSSKVMKDFEAINPEAAKVFKFKPAPKSDEIFVLKGTKGKELKRTIKHEVVEAGLMKKGSPYWKAHSIALQKEKV